MINQNLIDKLNQLRFSGMREALLEQEQQEAYAELGFYERLILLLDREITLRNDRRLTQRLKRANLKQTACVEHIDYKASRGLDRSLMLSLASCQWIRQQQNVLFLGPTGTGKTYLACALAHKACLEGYNAVYVRLPRLFQDLVIAKGDGRYGKFMQQLAKQDVLILDDWGLSPFTHEQCRDLLEILDDRHQSRSTIVTSQFPVKHWHESLGSPTLADAILDRLVHNAYKIELKGDSLRKQSAVQTDTSLALIQEVKS